MKYVNVALFIVILGLVAYLYVPKKEEVIPPLISRGQPVQQFLSKLHLAERADLEDSSCRIILVMRDSIPKRATHLREQIAAGFQGTHVADRRIIILYDPLSGGQQRLQQSDGMIVLVPDSGFSIAKNMGVRKEATFILFPGKNIVAESHNFVVNHQILLERLDR